MCHKYFNYVLGTEMRCVKQTWMIVICCRGEYFEYTLVNDIYIPVMRHRSWNKRDFDYDNVASAMLTLFAVQTGEGWPA